jgi:hypothetical protein
MKEEGYYAWDHITESVRTGSWTTSFCCVSDRSDFSPLCFCVFLSFLLSLWVVSGRSGWSIAKNISLWDYYAANKEASDRFNKAMTSVDKIGGEAVIFDYNWAQYKRAVDVSVLFFFFCLSLTLLFCPFKIGGSLGSVSALLLRNYPSLSAVVFDLPQVIDHAKQVWNNQHKV